MQLSLQKAFLSEYNRQERFYSKHNHYATNKPTNHSLQCHKRKPTFHYTSTGNLAPRKRIQRDWLSLLHPPIRRSGKHRLGCCSVRYYTINYLLQPFTPFTLIFHSNLSLVRTPDFAWCLYSSIGLRPTTVLSVGQRWMG